MSNIEVRSSLIQFAPAPGESEYPLYDLEKKGYRPSTSSAKTSSKSASSGTSKSTKSGKSQQSQESQQSQNTLNSLESDRWSKRGISSRISIQDEAEEGEEDSKIPYDDDGDDDDISTRHCAWMYKMWGNIILPGIFGVENHRYVKKMYHKHPIAKQLVSNIVKYNTCVRFCINDGLLLEIKELATQMFFPTGQIEADGLSVISAEIWAATYLLLCTHKKMREADHHNIRSAYSSLAWDSSQIYRVTMIFYKSFHEFREKFMPMWREIESLAGVHENSDLSVADSFHPSLRSMTLSMKAQRSKRKQRRGSQQDPPPLPTIRICDELELQNSLHLKIIPEKKSALVSEDDCKEKSFNELEYGRQVQIIKELLGKPGKIIQSAPTTLKLMESNLLNATFGRKQKLSTIPETPPLTPDFLDFPPLLSSVKILAETLKLIFKEVRITPSLRFDISENIRATAQDIHSFFAYTEWVISKFSEFHSMLQLCYNFALLSFDLDLPNFDKVSLHEKATDDRGVQFSASRVDQFEDDQVELKVVSLTKLLMEASFISIQRQGGVDEDFEWPDFFKTDYHLVLQRLPLRLGYNLLQFSQKAEGRMVHQQQIIAGNPNLREKSLTKMPTTPWSIHRLKERQEEEAKAASANNTTYCPKELEV